MTTPSSTTPTPQAIAAALFVQDIYYNANLRDSYYKALGQRNLIQQQTALNNLLKNYPIGAPVSPPATYADIPGGWATLTKQSLLAWTSLYKLIPVNGDDEHTLMVVGSRTSSFTVVFDAAQVIGAISDFPNTQSIKWSIGNGNATVNASITFSHDTIAGTGNQDPNTGLRKVSVKLWGKDETEPTDFTHIGHDFFEDIEQFAGLYNTTMVDVDTGDESGGCDVVIGLAVSNNPNSTANTGQVSVNVVADDNVTTVPVAKGVPGIQNGVTWTASDHTNVNFPDGDTAAWSQGGLNFSWSYTPGIQKADGTVSPGTLVRQMQGALLVSPATASQPATVVDVIGNLRPDTAVPDIPIDKALKFGIGFSVGLFLLLAAGIGIAIKKGIQYLRDKFKRDADSSNGKVLDPKDQIQEAKTPASLLKLEIELPRPSLADSVEDVNDSTTWKSKEDARGNEVFSSNGAPVVQNPVNSSGGVAKVTDSTTGKSSLAITEDDGSLASSVQKVTETTQVVGPTTRESIEIQLIEGAMLTNIKMNNKDVLVLSEHNGTPRTDERVEIR